MSVELGQCRARTMASDTHRCTRPASHWTHDFTAGGALVRMPLCAQHMDKIERHRRSGTADALLARWHAHS